jgi:hypothetical protein
MWNRLLNKGGGPQEIIEWKLKKKLKIFVILSKFSSESGHQTSPPTPLPHLIPKKLTIDQQQCKRE